MRAADGTVQRVNLVFSVLGLAAVMALFGMGVWGIVTGSQPFVMAVALLVIIIPLIAFRVFVVLARTQRLSDAPPADQRNDGHADPERTGIHASKANRTTNE